MCRCYLIWLALVLAVHCELVELARAQIHVAAPSSDDSRETARRQILDSDRWRRTRRGLNEWLSIQQIYSPAEVSTIRSEFQARVDKMSPTELQDTLDDMEEKLAVLTSPEAEDARRWISQFLSTARNAEEQLRAKRPNLAGMTASQIRRELQAFHDRRDGRQQAQAAFSQTRNQQLQSARDVHASRRQANEQARNRTPATIGSAAGQNQAATRREDLPGHSEPPDSRSPYYTVGPWGNPIRWDPLAGFW